MIHLISTKLSGFNAVAVLFLLTGSCGGSILEGQSELIGPRQPIVATVGNDIILPCNLKPAEDAFPIAFEWTRPDMQPRFVHVWRSGQNLEGIQHEFYEGRTSVFIDKLKHGDISLKLSKVKLSDEGKYRCFIPEWKKESFVVLVVGAFSSPAVTLEDNNSTDNRGVVLQCESKGWYPEPELLWLDGEGNLLSAGPSETVRGPDDLYTVSSRVTVEKRHSNSFTCRVQQKNINQTRETHILVSDDVFPDPSDSGSTAYIIGLVVGVLVILAVALAAWKWRQNKIKTKKKQEDEETQRGGEKNSTSNDSEQEGLLERETDSKQSKKERQIINNQNTMEDKNNLARLGEGTKLSYQTEEETHQEKTEGETSNILIQGQEESESITVEIAAPGPAEVETQKEQAGRTESVNTETATLMDGHRQQQQVRAAADTNNETEKEEKEEDIKSTKDEASSQGPTDDKRQHTDPTAGGGVMNDSDQTGGQAGRSDDPPVPAERKQQQVRAAGESSNDTNTVENKDLTQTTEKEAAAQGPTDDKTQPSDSPAGGGRQNDSELITGQKDTACTAESGHKVENGDRRDGEGNPTLIPPVKPDRLSKSEQKDLNKLVRQEASNDTKTVENKIQTQTKDDNAAAQGPTDDTTQPGDPPAGGETKITEEKDALCPAERRQKVKNGDRERDRGGSPTPLPPVKPDRLSKSEQKDLDKKNKDNKTESTNNKAAGPSEGETQQNDRPAVGGTMNESDQTGGPTGKSDDTPVPAERKRQKEQQEERRKSLMEGDGQHTATGRTRSK
uniref:Midasin-like n=1 Tax=Sander lucioperca TaxID=283035 RepID=A0A8C9X9L6_SANLU